MEIKSIVDNCYNTAKTLLTENRDILDYISKKLLEEETLDEKEFVALMDKVIAERNEDNTNN